MIEIWIACPKCGKQRWIEVHRANRTLGQCRNCGCLKYDFSTYDANNPKLGNQRRLYSPNGNTRIQIFIACSKCGIKRWVYTSLVKRTQGRCHECRKIKLPAYDLNNPKIGDKRRFYKPDGSGTCIQVWAACPICKKERWLGIHDFEITSGYCLRCSKKEKTKRGSESRTWKGGRVKTKQGYVKIYCSGHPYAVKNYVLEHRLIMEKVLGRYLLPSEIVHHKNGIKDDNRVENLVLVSSDEHGRMRTCGDCYLRKEIKLLTKQIQEHTSACKDCSFKREVRLLRWQIKELRESLQLKLQTEI